MCSTVVFKMKCEMFEIKFHGGTVINLSSYIFSVGLVFLFFFKDTHCIFYVYFLY